MKSLHKPVITLLALAALLVCARDSHAQRRVAARAARAVATDARVEKEGGSFVGKLFATVGGRRRQIADAAIDAWLIEGGRRIAYSAADGAGGFENEGHAIYVYDVGTQRRRKVMSEYFMVTDVDEVKTSRGRTALLVEMADGGLGASHFAVVDPNRGEVFYRRSARLTARRGDRITLGFWRDNDWGQTGSGGAPTARPWKTERHDLNALLRRRVIYNKPTNR